MKWIAILLLLTACTSTNMPMEDHMEHPKVTSEAMFIIDMIPHHQEAVDTAMLVKDSDKQQLATLANNIITTQTEEINMMNGIFFQRQFSTIGSSCFR